MADDDLVLVGLPKGTWDAVTHALEEEMVQLEPQGEWLGSYPGEEGVSAMEEAYREIVMATSDGGRTVGSFRANLKSLGDYNEATRRFNTLLGELRTPGEMTAVDVLVAEVDE